MNVTRQILDKAVEKGVMITVAESCTGGLLAAALTDMPGSSAVFERGFVTYTNAAKIEMLGVQDRTLAAHGAVSQEIAREMAQGALAASQAQIALGITGIAGPGGSEHKPEGRVCFGAASDLGCTSETVEFGALGRAQVRQAAKDHALAMILNILCDLPKK